MNSKTLGRLVVAGVLLLLFDCVLCVGIYLPQRAKVASTPTVQTPATPTITARPTTTATPPTTASVPTTPPPTRTVVTPPTVMPPTVTPARPTASPAPSLITSVADLEQSINAGQHGVPFSIIFSEQEIGNEIAAYMSSSADLPFSDVTVKLQPGVAIISGKVKVLGFNIAATATTTVVIVDGRLRLKVLKLDTLGGFLPGAVKDQLIKMIEQQSDLPLLADLPVTIQSVDIQTGQAVVEGVTN